MFCTSCGSQVPDDANVCPNCGKPLRAAAPQSGGSQVDLSGVTNAFKTFNYTAIDNLLPLIGCLVLLISTFLPVIGRGGESYNIFSLGKQLDNAYKGAGAFLIFQGILLILLALGCAALLILNFKKIFLCTAYVSSLAFMTVFTWVNTFGVFEYGSLGFYIMFIGTGLIVAGAIMHLLKMLKR